MAKETTIQAKPRVSVSEMAQLLELSRSRLYQLIDAGIMPMPVYCIYSKRPFYTPKLQLQCVVIKNTQIGINGHTMMFYRPRTKHRKTLNRNVANPHQEICNALKAMGLNSDNIQIKDAITKLYPQGINGREQGVVIREIYRFLQSK